MKKISLFIALLIATTLSNATTFVLPHNGDVVGQLKYAKARTGELLTEVGRRYDVGHDEIIKANPRINPLQPLFGGTKVMIPHMYVLPPGPRQGIVINLAELRLYYYPPGQNVVVTEPVGIGREGWNTPVGETTVVNKQVDPIWRPTANVRTEAAKNGTPIPAVFPPGRNNPLGKYVLRLGWPTYLIHGTNRPEGVGARVSAGCIRMLPEDVKFLYDNVTVGTKVRVLNEPLKIGKIGSDVYLETHPFLKEQRKVNRKQYIKKKLKTWSSQLDEKQLEQLISNETGIPQKIA